MDIDQRLIDYSDEYKGVDDDVLLEPVGTPPPSFTDVFGTRWVLKNNAGYFSWELHSTAGR